MPVTADRAHTLARPQHAWFLAYLAMIDDHVTDRIPWTGRVGAAIAALAALLALGLALLRSPETAYPLRIFLLTGVALALVVRRGMGRHVGWKLFLAICGLSVITLSYAGFWGPTMEEQAPGADSCARWLPRSLRFW